MVHIAVPDAPGLLAPKSSTKKNMTFEFDVNTVTILTGWCWSAERPETRTSPNLGVSNWSVAPVRVAALAVQAISREAEYSRRYQHLWPLATASDSPG